MWFRTYGRQIVELFDKTFPEDGGPIFNNPNNADSINFQSSPPAVQVKGFLKELGLTDTHIQMFVYKIRSKQISIENPHIDTPGNIPLPGRFNVIVYGNKNSKMHWWNKDITHPELHHAVIPKFGKRWQVLGDSVREQLDILGKSDYSTDNLSKINQTGDFVRTDIVHAIERDGERRVILSAKINHPWEEIIEKIKNV
jgi:hypothetical protein